MFEAKIIQQRNELIASTNTVFAGLLMCTGRVSLADGLNDAAMFRH